MDTHYTLRVDALTDKGCSMDTVSLSYWPQALSIKEDSGIRYVFDASHASLPLYFSLKGKHGYSLDNRETFVAAIRPLVESVAAVYDLVVYPESRFSFVAELVKNLPAQQLHKRSKDEVIELALAHAGWSKQERRSQERCWLQMGDCFTINQVKANQRRRYMPYLFETIDVSQKRVLFLDDFIMSGNTRDAAWAAMGLAGSDSFGVFYQPAYKVER